LRGIGHLLLNAQKTRPVESLFGFGNALGFSLSSFYSARCERLEAADAAGI
jgi:hypothetical protein